MPRRIAAIVLAFTLAASACGGDGDDASAFPAGAFALSASSNLAVGTERLLVAVVAQDGTRLASPDIPITVRVRPEGGEATEPLPATFMWAVPDNSGLYRVAVDFPTAGTWFIEVTPEGGGTLPEFPVTVLPQPITVGLGQPAPASDTPTAADSELAAISSDDDPDPR
ncbi:MAG TPA: FixH family protein, partial [Acidimicrobiia bacterium]|nr:FixH family protein [Acidimicrobiia bacterium]